MIWCRFTASACAVALVLTRNTSDWMVEMFEHFEHLLADNDEAMIRYDVILVTYREPTKPHHETKGKKKRKEKVSSKVGWEVIWY